MAKRPIREQVAEYALHHPIFPPDVVEQARKTLQELWLPRLRKEMGRAHPDAGGTVAKFIAARKRYEAAKASTA